MNAGTGNDKKAAGMRKVQPQIRKYLMAKAAHKQIPLSGTFELTPRCNMNCRMCYIRMSETEMREHGREYTAKEWLELGKACVESGMLFLLLTGGEPFLRPDFREIYLGLKKLGLIVSINSNATLIDEEVVGWLSQDPPTKINITLYGKNSETYRRLCGHAKGYEAAIRGIELLLQAGICVDINVSLTKYNIEDLPQIVLFAKERGLKLRASGYMFPPVRSAREGEIDKEVRFTPEEFAKARYEFAKLNMTKKEIEVMHKHFQAGELEWMAKDDECNRIPDEKMGCMAGRGSFWVTWDGRMTPCGMMNEPVTRPFEDGFLPAWIKITEEIEKIYLPSECGECSARKLCPICGALAIAEGNGDSTKRPDYLCQGTKGFIELMRRAE